MSELLGVPSVGLKGNGGAGGANAVVVPSLEPRLSLIGGVSRTVSAIGEQGMKTVKTAHKWFDDHYDNVLNNKANEASNELQNLLNLNNAEYSLLKGKNAIDGREEYLERGNKIVQHALENCAPEVRPLLEIASKNMQNEHDTNVHKHRMSEEYNYSVEVGKGNVSQAGNNLLQKFDTDGEDTATEQFNASIDYLTNLQGLDPTSSQAETIRQASWDEVVKSRFALQIATDAGVGKAMTFLDRMHPRISEEMYNQLYAQGMAKRESIAKQAQAKYESLLLAKAELASAYDVQNDDKNYQTDYLDKLISDNKGKTDEATAIRLATIQLRARSALSKQAYTDFENSQKPLTDVQKAQLTKEYIPEIRHAMENDPRYFGLTPSQMDQAAQLEASSRVAALDDAKKRDSDYIYGIKQDAQKIYVEDFNNGRLTAEQIADPIAYYEQYDRERGTNYVASIRQAYNGNIAQFSKDIQTYITGRPLTQEWLQTNLPEITEDAAGNPDSIRRLLISHNITPSEDNVKLVQSAYESQPGIAAKYGKENYGQKTLSYEAQTILRTDPNFELKADDPLMKGYTKQLLTYINPLVNNFCKKHDIKSIDELILEHGAEWELIKNEAVVQMKAWSEQDKDALDEIKELSNSVVGRDKIIYDYIVDKVYKENPNTPMDNNFCKRILDLYENRDDEDGEIFREKFDDPSFYPPGQNGHSPLSYLYQQRGTDSVQARELQIAFRGNGDERVLTIPIIGVLDDKSFDQKKSNVVFTSVSKLEKLLPDKSKVTINKADGDFISGMDKIRDKFILVNQVLESNNINTSSYPLFNNFVASRKQPVVSKYKNVKLSPEKVAVLNSIRDRFVIFYRNSVSTTRELLGGIGQAEDNYDNNQYNVAGGIANGIGAGAILMASGRKGTIRDQAIDQSANDYAKKRKWELKQLDEMIDSLDQVIQTFGKAEK